MGQVLRTAGRQRVHELFQAGLAAVQGQRCVSDFLSQHPLRRPVSLVAIGKAACSMTHGAMEVPGKGLVNGLIITRAGHGDVQLDQDPRLHCIESGHPLPNHDSLLAGAALCQFLETVPDDNDLLFLVSGGASSLVEVLPDHVSLDDLVRINRWLLGSGRPIDEVNRIRQRLSRIKGGGLLAWVKDRPAVVLLISDVPGDDPGTIGSGLLYPGKSSPITTDLPDWLELPPVTDSRLPATVQHHIIATNSGALQAAADKGRGQGHTVTIMEQPLVGEAQLAGQAIASQLQQLPDGVYLWGGETTVTLPEHAGAGGRNQHLALSAAQALPGHEDIVILAAGTDGSDGVTDDAGAIVDCSTLARGQAQGFDASTCLRRANSGRFLKASGDLLKTGPTGTNVMDMVIAYKGDCNAIRQA